MASWPKLFSDGALGWGLLSQFLPFRYFPNFSALSKHTLDIEFHVDIWQVSPQLSAVTPLSNMNVIERIEHFAYGVINEPRISNPHPWPVRLPRGKWSCRDLGKLNRFLSSLFHVPNGVAYQVRWWPLKIFLSRFVIGSSKRWYDWSIYK